MEGSRALLQLAKFFTQKKKEKIRKRLLSSPAPPHTLSLSESF
jgi:hypothetical protein